MTLLFAPILWMENRGVGRGGDWPRRQSPAGFNPERPGPRRPAPGSGHSVGSGSAGIPRVPGESGWPAPRETKGRAAGAPLLPGRTASSALWSRQSSHQGPSSCHAPSPGDWFAARSSREATATGRRHGAGGPREAGGEVPQPSPDRPCPSLAGPPQSPVTLLGCREAFTRRGRRGSPASALFRHTSRATANGFLCLLFCSSAWGPKVAQDPVLSGPHSFFFFLIFLMFIFETERVQRGDGRRGAGGGGHRIRSRLQAPSRQHRARRGARTHKPRDRGLSRIRTLNRPSHPGAPSCPHS